jgi:hypothetical protein
MYLLLDQTLMERASVTQGTKATGLPLPGTGESLVRQ